MQKTWVNKILSEMGNPINWLEHICLEDAILQFYCSAVNHLKCAQVSTFANCNRSTRLSAAAISKWWHLAWLSITDFHSMTKGKPSLSAVRRSSGMKNDIHSLFTPFPVCGDALYSNYSEAIFEKWSHDKAPQDTLGVYDKIRQFTQYYKALFVDQQSKNIVIVQGGNTLASRVRRVTVIKLCQWCLVPSFPDAFYPNPAACSHRMSLNNVSRILNFY